MIALLSATFWADCVPSESYHQVQFLTVPGLVGQRGVPSAGAVAPPRTMSGAASSGKVRRTVLTRRPVRCGDGWWPFLPKDELELPAGLFGGLVLPDLVEQVTGEAFATGAPGSLTAAVDQRHQGTNVPGRPGEEVVGQLVGEHAGIRVGQDDALFQGQEQLTPVTAALFGIDGEGGHVQASGAPAGLRQNRVSGRLVLAGCWNRRTSYRSGAAFSWANHSPETEHRGRSLIT